MNLNLTAKTAVVTGASRGIGLATAQTLTGEDVQVAGAARTIGVLEAVTREWLLGR
jgi:NADP-dependent 3-hydroxy acid dehydrogenase YdfG